MITRTILVTLAVTLAACGGDTKQDTKTAKKVEPAKVEPMKVEPAKVEPAKDAPRADAAGPFAAWDMAGRTAAFAGAHLTPGGSLGAWDAWEVTGDKVKVWDGTAEKTYDLKVKSPCEADVIEVQGGGSSSTTTHYTVKDGKLIMGLGDAGSRKGPEAIACVSNAVVSLDAAGKCTQWEESMFDKGKYEAKPGDCKWAKEGDKEVFVAKVNGMDTKLLVDGDALMTEQLQQVHSEKQADYATARTARDAKAGKVAGK
jgi:hypothetical protein